MQPSTFWRREVFEKYGPFDEELHYGFDWAYWCELTRNNCKFYRLHDVLSANRVYEETKTSSGGKDRLAELRSINRKYKTSLLDNAYYSFSFSDYYRKNKKSLIDYILQAYYFVMSYQNILFHMMHAEEKIINGVLPHSNYLQQYARLTIPLSRKYSRIQISLATHGFCGQEVTIEINGKIRNTYKFSNDRLYLNINAEELSGDVDIKMTFEHTYTRPLSFVKKLKTFYQPKIVSAELLSFTVI
jgi:hypothetical protein